MKLHRAKTRHERRQHHQHRQAVIQLRLARIEPVSPRFYVCRKENGMTVEQKKCIEELRVDGLSFGQIGIRLGISKNTIKSYFRRFEERKKRCKRCGRDLVQIPKRKPRTFCSTQCRKAWWKDHREEICHREVKRLACAYCGRTFDVPVNSGRKYCGHPCYILDRFGVSYLTDEISKNTSPSQ